MPVLNNSLPSGRELVEVRRQLALQDAADRAFDSAVRRLPWLGGKHGQRVSENLANKDCFQEEYDNATPWAVALYPHPLQPNRRRNDKSNSLGGPLGVKSKVEPMGRDLATKGAQIAGEKAGQAIEAEIAGKAGLAGAIAAVGTWLGRLLGTPALVVGNVIGGLLGSLTGPTLVGCVVHPLTNGHVLQIISYYYFSHCQSLHPILRVEIKRPKSSSTSANSAGV
ncbi:hypothetical protein FOC1_g10004559 [Fusarium oxysporum f. sp. cubense race 1]|uniref:Uncharacterized protein n=1 Tax=Fusarium oxysporum f. sp. cubense (strain race 1) TaxID=1229664 RepID=N4U8Z4_FUSC1|nr:hypothetical protein FOC1_g10004559 [Fusarium oxysporum f. sp. cubense race 1]